MNVTEREMPVLRALCSRSGDFAYMSFATIGAEADPPLDRATVRRGCRALKRKGLAEFASGMWDEDGRPAGSGYAATDAGHAIIDQLDATPPAVTPGASTGGEHG